MSEEIIDLPEFLERVQDDKELLLELLDIFTEDYKIKRLSLAEAVEKNNFEEIRSLSHSLKGASGNISAKALRQTFLQFEEIGKKNDMTGADAILKDMDQKFQELVGRVDTLKKELK